MSSMLNCEEGRLSLQSTLICFCLVLVSFCGLLIPSNLGNNLVIQIKDLMNNQYILHQFINQTIGSQHQFTNDSFRQIQHQFVQFRNHSLSPSPSPTALSLTFTLEDLITKTESESITNYNQSFYKNFFGSTLFKPYDHQHSSNICELPNFMEVCSHKTGGYFSTWRKVFNEECNLFRNNRRKRKRKRRHKKHMASESIAWEQYSEFKAIQSFVNKQRNNNDFFIMFSVRQPLYTILSGYNYHAMGEETAWTDESLEKVMKPGPVTKKLKFCFQDIFNDSILINTMRSTMYKEYSKGWMDQQRNADALQHGLYLEFTRYVNCEYPYLIESYSKLKADLEKYNPLIIRFEWFHDANYSQSINYLLDAMDIKREIYENKTNLFDRLKNPNYRQKHTTKDKYNKTQQIELLLTSGTNNVCANIKTMTLNLDYPWEYNDFC